MNILILLNTGRKHLSLGIGELTFGAASEITLAELSLHRKKKESDILRFDFLTFTNMKIPENSGRPFENSSVRK